MNDAPELDFTNEFIVNEVDMDSPFTKEEIAAQLDESIAELQARKASLS